MKASRGVLAALGGAFCLSWTGILLKYILLHFEIAPLTLAFWRALFISVALLAVLGITRPQSLRVGRQHVGFYLAYGLFGVGMAHAIWIQSVNLNGAALATVLVYMAPVFVTVVSRRLFGEPNSRYLPWALLCMIVGAVLVSEAHDLRQLALQWGGVVVGLLAAMTYGSFSLFGKAAQSKGHESWAAMTWSFAAGTFFLALTQRPSQVFSLGTEWRGWAAIALLALVPSLGGYGLITQSLRDLAASTSSLITPLEIVFAAANAFVILDERLTVLQLVGAGLIGLSAALASLQPRELRGEKR